MSNGAKVFTPEKLARLMSTPIDLSDFPEIDFSQGWLYRDRISGKVKPRLVQGDDGKMPVFD